MMRLRNILTGMLGLTAILLVPGTTVAQPAAPAGPMTVDDAVRFALQHNPLYLQAVAQIGVNEGARMNALAGVLPVGSGAWSYSKNNSTFTRKDFELTGFWPAGADPRETDPTVTSRGDFPIGTDRSASTWNLGVREDFSLTRWYNYRSAQADVASARWGKESAAQQLAFDVRQQYYLALRAQDLLVVQEEDLRLARDEERRINSMFELGSVARVDVLKARVRVSDAEVALITQRNAVEIEKTRLATLIGFRADATIDLVGNLSQDLAPVDSSSAAMEARERPDIQQAQENVRSARNAAKAAGWSRIPGLFASFDWLDSEGTTVQDEFTQQLIGDVPNPGDISFINRAAPTDSDFGLNDWTFRVGASVTLDLFLNSGQAKRARRIQQQAELALEGQELEVQRELEEAILNLRASVSAIEAAESGVESAEEDQRLSQERYQQGLGTILELLESQVALTRARNTMVNALTGLKISEAALDKARGAPLPYVEED